MIQKTPLSVLIAGLMAEVLLRKHKPSQITKYELVY